MAGSFTEAHRAGGQPPSAARDRVEFRAVQKSYDGTNLVVRDLNLAVREGEFLTMLGPSGSGKTTTLMMLAGFERPTLGQILLDGKPVEALPPERRNIGMVFQNYALFPHMTVDENIAFPLRYRGIRGEAARERVRKARAMVHLDAMADRRPGQLSGGQQQRVALARALVFEPALVLMDEPLGALDKQLREHMQREIKQIQTELGITMVYVTHDQSEALNMSDRIAVFHDGVIQQLADPVTLYTRPANAFVAGFIGENNLIPCQNAEPGLVICPDGTRLRATGAVAGTGRSYLSIRPERLRILPALSDVTANVFDARLTEMVFQGDHVSLRVSALGQTDLALRADAADLRGLAPGDALRLSCRIEDCLIVGDAP
ncbi:spermidine/putrescine ABC transporter, ATP-binding subunit (plasmid) [Paracoccus aminophilus JCM 7686]|uniref:Spermidine/putrescine ABC transporter, ATP-binding subunit n=2 Tax=Paracoccus aminophilus TaxID=34003 RepID=S5YZK1_PARAH|nr:spermidine/putrescine ABC transporter, ATP-binding subunit [Paracoccus aminophilus JCM 7686]